MKMPKIEFPSRQKSKGYQESERARNHVEDRYAHYSSKKQPITVQTINVEQENIETE